MELPLEGVNEALRTVTVNERMEVPGGTLGGVAIMVKPRVAFALLLPPPPPPPLPPLPLLPLAPLL